ncbi:uncharacterized protein EKO05_0002798 [Ascochyta rabiei]|nr:uncharacterized protein EKO05_0002798 [Ascochyta rabiei]UPX12241.1 hypothetical protein EKO05_0002798 [Ascochyta rabiei]
MSAHFECEMSREKRTIRVVDVRAEINLVLPSYPPFPLHHHLLLRHLLHQ